MRYLQMKTTLPNLRHLQALYKTVQCKSISQATQQVFLSQSAITQAIQKIEKILGITLFHRTGKRMLAKPEAQLYTARIERFFNFINEGQQEAIKNQTPKVGFEKYHSSYKASELTYSMTTTQLHAFLEMGDKFNYTYAAKQLGTSQPAIHRAIRDLEQLMNVALFEKTSQGLVLTKSGLTLWQYCNLAVNELYQGVMDIQAYHDQFEGKIRIGCMPLSRHELLPQALITFQKKYPRIDIQIIDGSYEAMLRALQMANLDFLLGALRGSTLENTIQQLPLFQSQLCIAVNPKHPLVSKSQSKPLTITDLLNYPWALPAKDTPTRERFEQLLATHAVTSYPQVIETSSVILIRGLLLEGNYLTLISHQQVKYEIAQGIFTILNFNIADTPRDIGITYRTHWQPSYIHQEFLNIITETSHKLTER